MCLKIGEAFSASEEHAEQAAHCVRMCCCSVVCREVASSETSFLFMKRIVQRFCGNSRIVHDVLRYCNWASPRLEDLRRLFSFGALGLCIKCMSRHRGDALVLRPGMHFLCRSCSVLPAALAYVLKKRCVSLIVHASLVLAADEEFLEQALKLVREISQTQEGWAQLEEIPGGWQALCFGSVEGNALVHDLEGSFHNAGWCLGDSRFLPTKEQQSLHEAAIAGARSRTRVNWSLRTLRDYMKTSASQQQLEINLERDQAHFELLSSLDLLPEADELRQDWYIRLFKYEKANGVALEDMVSTMLEIRRRERGDGAAGEQEYVKPIFVSGELVTAEGLDLQDVTAEDKLRAANVDDLDED